LALSLGAVIGISPLLWGTGLLCILLAARLRLNLVAVQLANVAVWPLQLILFLPWLELGGWFFGSSPSASQTATETAGPIALVQRFGEANLQALVAWLLTAPLWFALLFLLCNFFCRRLLPGPRL
jgi:hypothetical protein